MTSIYKITSPSYPGKCYIGSTTRTIQQRLWEHCNDFKQNHIHCSSSQLLDKQDAIIELLEICPIENRKIREQYHIDSNDCINKNYPCSTLERRKELHRKWKNRHIICMICDVECGITNFKRHFKTYHTEK